MGCIPTTHVPPQIHKRGKAIHTPFVRPHTYQPQFKPSKVTNLQRLSGYMEPTMERTYPFANHNTPWAADLLTPPYVGRITIRSDPPPKEEQKSLASQHNITWNQAKTSKRTLIVYSDGSKNLTGNKQTTGYGLIRMCQGKQVFTISVKHSHKSSQFDTEMYAIAHASWKVLLYLDRNPTITKVRYYSDCSSTLKSIMDRGPHTTQFASILFRVKTHKLLTKNPNVKVSMEWTPGHRGVIGQSIVDKLAKKASKSRGPTLLDESTKSHVKQTLCKELIRRWRVQCGETEIPTTSGIYQASKVLRPNPIPDQIMKQTPLKLSGWLNQTLTGHSYHSEYYHQFNIPDNPTNCFCSSTPVLQTRDHIISNCPMYDDGRAALLTQFPHLQNPCFQLSSLFRRDRQPHLIWWLKKSSVFTKRGIPWEEIPTYRHNPGPSTIINEAYELPE